MYKRPPIVDVLPVDSVGDGNDAVFDETDDAAKAFLRVQLGNDVKEAFAPEGEHFRPPSRIGEQAIVFSRRQGREVDDGNFHG